MSAKVDMMGSSVTTHGLEKRLTLLGETAVKSSFVIRLNQGVEI